MDIGRAATHQTAYQTTPISSSLTVLTMATSSTQRSDIPVTAPADSTVDRATEIASQSQPSPNKDPINRHGPEAKQQSISYHAPDPSVDNERNERPYTNLIACNGTNLLPPLFLHTNTHTNKAHSNYHYNRVTKPVVQIQSKYSCEAKRPENGCGSPTMLGRWQDVRKMFVEAMK